MFVVTKLITVLLDPANLLFFGFFSAVLVMGRKSRLAWPLRLLCLIFLAIWITPLADALLAPLEMAYPRPTQLPARVDGIVVLGGWQDLTAGQQHGVPAVNEAAERLLTGLSLAQQHPEAKLLFSGGNGNPRYPELSEGFVNRLVLDALRFPRERALYEDRSRNTAENARFSHQMVQPKPGDVWILVTSASHMPRAMRCFSRLDWNVIPYPCDYRSIRPGWFRDLRIVDPLGRLTSACYEWAGLAAYGLFGAN